MTVCSAYVGQLGTLKDGEHAIQQADEILSHFKASSPQARRYSLILRKLFGAVLDYVQDLEHRSRNSQSKFIPELFRLNLSRSDNTSVGSQWQTEDPEPTGHPTRSPSFAEAVSMQTTQVDPELTNQQSWESSDTISGSGGIIEPANTSRTDDGPSLLDLAHTFYEVNTTWNLDFDQPPVYDSLLDFENTESIWDLNWGGSLL